MAEWPTGTTPEERLRGWVGAMMERLLGEDRQPWHMQLMMREVASPDVACEALVKEYIRPHFEYSGSDSERVAAGRGIGRAACAVGFQRGRARFVLSLCPADHAAAAGRTGLRDDDSAGAGRACHGDDARGAWRPAGRRRRGVRAMSWVALKMLTGNKGKYIGIILGVAFAALLISQQASIFCGMMLLTTSQIKDIDGADIWVMDPNVRFVDDVKPISENDLYRVRGVEGVGWAVRLYKGLTRARMPGTGKFQQVILIGLDDATLVGAPQPDKIVMGNIGDLRRPDAVFVDEDGYAPALARRADGAGPDVRDERPSGHRRRGVSCPADVSNQAGHLHPLQPIDAVRSAAAQGDVVHSRPAESRLRFGRRLPADQGSNRPGSPDAGSVLLDDDAVLPARDRNSGQLRHHRGLGIHHRHGHRRPDVLPVHGRESQTVRHAQSHGGQQQHVDLR